MTKQAGRIWATTDANASPKSTRDASDEQTDEVGAKPESLTETLTDGQLDQVVGGRGDTKPSKGYTIDCITGSFTDPDNPTSSNG